MDKFTKKIAVGFAVIVFMIMAITAQIYHRPAMTSCIRAVSGAVAAYVVTTFAVKAVFAILIRAIADSRSKAED